MLFKNVLSVSLILLGWRNGTAAEFANTVVLESVNKSITSFASEFTFQGNEVDSSLGSEWLMQSDNVSDSLLRSKRAVGTAPGDTITTLLEVASQVIGPEDVDIGDSFTFKYVIDLPSVLPEQRSDLIIEAFGIDPNNGIGSFHICQNHVDSLGAKIKAIDPRGVYAENIKDGFVNFAQKSSITLEQLHTDGYGANDDLTSVIAQFQAILLDSPDLLTGTKYFITAGASFAEGSHVWINQAEITTNLVPKNYDFTIQLAVAPTAIKKGDAELFQVTAYVTHPGTFFEFGIYPTLGMHDLFHIGKINKVVGNAFACSQEKYWEEKRFVTPSGLSVSNASLNYPMLINREAARDVTLDVNRIDFFIPIHILNIESVPAGISRELSFVANVGSDNTWTAVHEVTIFEADTTDPIPLDIRIEKVYLKNEVLVDDPYPEIPAGDGVVFAVEVLVYSGWANFDTVLSGKADQGFKAIGARVADSGLIGYFSPTWLVTGQSGDTISVNWGLVKNVSPDLPTKVVIDLIFTSDRSSPTMVIDETSIAASISGQHIDLPAVKVIENPKTWTGIEVVQIPYSINLNILSAGKLGMEFLVTVPSGSGGPYFVFEALPDTDVQDVDMRVCKVRIEEVGKALPCLGAINLESLENHQKFVGTESFDNYGIIEVDEICPIKHPDEKSEDNQFRFSFFYELPRNQPVPTSVNYTLSGGLQDDEDIIWIGSEVYDFDLGGNTLAAGDSVPTLQSLDPHPFFAIYPIVTHRDRTQMAFDNKESVFVKAILKTHPQSASDYSVTINVEPYMKICKISISHIGENMPCMKAPEETVTPYDNIVMEWSPATDPNRCGSDVKINMLGVTNFGFNPLVEDLTPDRDSIVFDIYYQVCADPAPLASSIQLPLQLEYYHADGGVLVEDFNAEIDLTGIDKPPTGDMKIDAINYTSLVGSNDVLYKRAPKVLQVEVPVPPGYLGNLTLELVNNNYDKDVYIDLCSMYVVKLGDNLPCIELKKDVVTSPGTEFKYTKDGKMYRSMSMTVIDLCFTDISRSEIESLMTVEVAFRAGIALPVGTEVSFTMNVIPVAPVLTESFPIGPFVVRDPMEGDISTDVPEVERLKVYEDPAYAVSGHPVLQTGQKALVTFYIEIPPDTIFEVEASFLLPSFDGIAILHANDVMLSESTNATSLGTNVICTGPEVDLKSTYDTRFFKVENLTTFMQNDGVTIDFGYIMNRGITKKQNNYDSTGVDDDFALSVEVQLSDHVNTTDASELEVYLAVSFGDFIVVGVSKVIVSRTADRTAFQEMASIMIEASSPEVEHGQPLTSWDKIHVNTVVYHLNSSKAECYPFKMRVLFPTYVSFTNDDVISTNYSVSIADPSVSVYSQSNTTAYMDLVFEGGLTYPDIVSLNFTLTVDPFQKRHPGSGEALGSITMQPLCTQNVFNLWPPAGIETRNAGNFRSLPIRVITPDCYDPIPFINPCQIRASSMISADYKPYNVVTTSSVWSPAVRDIVIGQDFVEFDFLSVARINRIHLGTNDIVNTKVYRPVQRVLVTAGLTPKSLQYVTEADVTLNFVEFPSTIVARFVRITILQAPGDAHLYPIGLNEVRFEGCLPRNLPPRDAAKCFPRTTIDASSPMQYRHFAVDDDKDIVYFCDMSPYLLEMQCFYSDRSIGTNTWNALPGYVKGIKGFSKSRARMYLTDETGASIMSTLNGQTLELTHILPTDVIPAVGVPGDVATKVDVKHWTGTLWQYKGTYIGLYKDSELLVEWKSCCSP